MCVIRRADFKFLLCSKSDTLDEQLRPSQVGDAECVPAQTVVLPASPIFVAQGYRSINRHQQQ